MFIFSCTKQSNEVPFSMAIGNGELMHECFTKHSRMGTARLKEDNGTDEKDKKYGKKKGRHERKSLSLPNQNIIINKIW